MGLIRYSVTSEASSRLASLILDDCHQLLEQVGLEVKLPRLLKELAGYDGVTVRGERVCLAPELVERSRAQVPEQDLNYATHTRGEENFRMCPPFSPFQVIDFDSGEKRPARESDVVEGARLYDSFGVVGPVHVHLEHMDQKIAQVFIAKLCCENSSGIGNWSPAYSYEQAVAIRDMYLAAGRQGPYVAFQLTHSPLKLDAFFLETILRARDESAEGTKGLTAGGGSMPLPGVSSPIHYRSAAAQGLAECLGAWTLLKLIDPEMVPYASFMPWVPDMSTATWTFDLPEAVIFDLLNRQISEQLLGLSIYHRCDNLAQMCLHAIQGCRIFECGGERQGCFSLAHIPIDREKINFVQRLAAGMSFPEEEGLTLQIVQEVLPETSFLMHESTMAFAEMFWSPELFKSLPPAQVANSLYADDDRLLPEAREIVRRRLAEHRFELAPETAAEVESIYQSARKAILG